MLRRGVLAACAVLLCSFSSVLGHSWLGCADYRGDVSTFDWSKCYAFPRNFQAGMQLSSTKPTDPSAIGNDMGFNYNGGDSCNKPMTSPVSSAYSTTYPMAVYEQGGTYCLAHPTKNHVAGDKCTNAYIPDTRMTVFRSGVNPSSSRASTSAPSSRPIIKMFSS